MRSTRIQIKDEDVSQQDKLPASPSAGPATRGVLWFPMNPMSSKKLNPDGFKVARSRRLEDIRMELSYTGKRVISQIFRADGLTIDWLLDRSVIPLQNFTLETAANSRKPSNPALTEGKEPWFPVDIDDRPDLQRQASTSNAFGSSPRARANPTWDPALFDSRSPHAQDEDPVYVLKEQVDSSENCQSSPQYIKEELIEDTTPGALEILRSLGLRAPLPSTPGAEIAVKLESDKLEDAPHTLALTSSLPDVKKSPSCEQTSVSAETLELPPYRRSFSFFTFEDNDQVQTSDVSRTGSDIPGFGILGRMRPALRSLHESNDQAASSPPVVDRSRSLSVPRVSFGFSSISNASSSNNGIVLSPMSSSTSSLKGKQPRKRSFNYIVADPLSEGDLSHQSSDDLALLKLRPPHLMNTGIQMRSPDSGHATEKNLKRPRLDEIPARSSSGNGRQTQFAMQGLGPGDLLHPGPQILSQMAQPPQQGRKSIDKPIRHEFSPDSKRSEHRESSPIILSSEENISESDSGSSDDSDIESSSEIEEIQPQPRRQVNIEQKEGVSNTSRPPRKEVIRIAENISTVTMPKVPYGRARRIIHAPEKGMYVWASQRGDVQFIQDHLQKRLSDFSLPADGDEIMRVDDACLVSDRLVALGCQSSAHQLQLVDLSSPRRLPISNRPHDQQGRGGVSCVTATSTSSSGDVASGGFDHKVVLWRITRQVDDDNQSEFAVQCRAVRAAQHTSLVNSVAHSGTKNWLCSGGSDKKLCLVDLSTDRAVVQPYIFRNPVYHVHVHPTDGNMLFLEMGKGLIVAYDLRKLKYQSETDEPDRPVLQLGGIIPDVTDSKYSRYAKGALWQDMFAQGSSQGVKLWNIRNTVRTVQISPGNKATHILFTATTLVATGENLVDFVQYI